MDILPEAASESIRMVFKSSVHSCVGRETRGASKMLLSESVVTLPPFSPIEGQKWFDQISSQ
jgi:hypothetical protein